MTRLQKRCVVAVILFLVLILLLSRSWKGSRLDNDKNRELAQDRNQLGMGPMEKRLPNLNLGPGGQIQGPDVLDNRNLKIQGPGAQNNNPPKIDGAVNESSAASHSSKTGQQLVSAARGISERWGSVLFSVVNDAYLDLVNSWLCNTAVFPDIHPRVLFLASDAGSARELNHHWPNVSVVVMEGGEQFQGNQEYSHVGYVRLMVERTRFIRELLEAGVPVFLFEVDFVWLRNPLPYVLNQTRNADVVGVTVWGTSKVCGCFLYLKPTPASLQLWSRLTEQMEDLYKSIAKHSKTVFVSEGKNDQVFLSTLLNKNYGGIKLVRLPEKLFPEGVWYMKSKVRKSAPDPWVIHNNWIAGNANKISRAKKFGHWFLLVRNVTENVIKCDTNLVQKVIKK